MPQGTRPMAGAIVFMVSLAAAAVCGFVFLLFLSHCYLTVLESTGAGAKEVVWISEPMTDHFGKLVYLGWLIGLWLGPAVFIGRALTTGTATPWLAFAVPLLVLWVCFPVSQLSSLSATSMWYPLVPDVFTRLAQKPAVVLGFFAFSACVVAVFGVAFHWAFLTKGDWELLFVGAPLLVLTVVLYARLLGRLAFVLRFTQGLFQAKKRKKPKVEPKPVEPEAPRRPRQPEELPPVNTPEGELMGYNIFMEDDAPPPVKKRVRAEAADEPDDASNAAAPPRNAPPPLPAPARSRKPAPESAVERGRVWTDEDDEETTPYGVHEAEVVMGDVVPKELIKATADEIRLLSRDDVPKKPKRAWGPEVLAFLGQQGTVTAVVIASAMCVMAGMFVRVARAFNPNDSGGE